MGAPLAPLLLAARGAARLLSRGSPARVSAVRFPPTDRGAAVASAALGDSTGVGVGASHPERG